ncbi:MAG: hypothetical protein ACI93R_002246 [Flavobacteriales bacterium]
MHASLRLDSTVEIALFEAAIELVNYRSDNSVSVGSNVVLSAWVCLVYFRCPFEVFLPVT